MRSRIGTTSRCTSAAARFRSGGHGFCGIGRKRLLNILQQRCESLGVELVFETDVASDAQYPDADLIVACDGLNSRIRNLHAATYEPDLDLRRCRFVWLGTHKRFEAFTFAFEETEHGWFQAHAYRFDDDTSTFIVETPEEVWQRSGLDRMEKEASIEFCERLFARHLDGHRLISNAAHLRGSAQWIRFPRVVCRRWVHDDGRVPVVLMGDAAHTAHFSIGSGTKLALEDAIELARCIGRTRGDVRAALEAYEAARSVEVQRIQNAARNSTEWFENVARYAKLPPEQFAYSLLTRSQRISHENLRLRDRGYVEGFEDWVAERSGVVRSAGQMPVPPMFTPFTARSVTLRNRVVVSPMAQYSCVDGVPGDFHLVHLGARALGGAGLVVAEMTCVSPDARITPGCPGLWNEAQRDGWKRIVDFVHGQSEAKIAMQLGHAGAKGSTRVAWEGTDEPLPAGNWPLVSASPQQYLDGMSDWSRAMTRADMDRVRDDFVRSARMRRKRASTGWSCIARTAISCRASSRRSPTFAPMSMAARCAIACAIRLRCSRAVRAVWPQHLADVGAHLRARLGRRRHHAGRRGRDRACVQGCGRGHDRLLVGAGQQEGEAGVRPHVPDAVRGPHPQRGGHSRRSLSARSPRPITSTASSPPDRADLCAVARPHLANPAWTLHRSREDRLPRPCRGRSNTGRRSSSSRATSSGSARSRRSGGSVAARASQSRAGGVMGLCADNTRS